jgi:hypothetical protein
MGKHRRSYRREKRDDHREIAWRVWEKIGAELDEQKKRKPKKKRRRPNETYPDP